MQGSFTCSKMEKMSTSVFFSFHECQPLFDNAACKCNNNVSMQAVVLKCVETKTCTAGSVCRECKLRLQEFPQVGWRTTWNRASLWKSPLRNCFTRCSPDLAAGPSLTLTIVNVLAQSGQPVFVGASHWFCHREWVRYPHSAGENRLMVSLC